MSDIFISYSRYDSDVVNELVTLLEREGYSVWIDRDGIESGDDFKRVILKAIKESKVVLFFSSEHSNVSDWTAKEIGVAVKYKKHIIPIMLDDSNFNEAVEFDLINLDYVDYSKVLTRLAMRERLFKTLRNKLGMGSKESERLEAERKAKEEAERARLEKERLAKAEAERLTKETAEKKRLEEERRAEEERRKTEQERIAAEKKQNNTRQETTNSFNGHEYVDLGLPSGTLWATCNVGANKPEEYGDYFAWGEIHPKTNYGWDTYKYSKTKKRLFKTEELITKYCGEAEFGYDGFTDGLAELQPIDDPATANWGNGWYTPKREQWDELKANTNSEWTTRNGVEGRLFTSKKNGQSLFLPDAGYRWYDELSYAGSHGCYGSSSLRTDGPLLAWIFGFNSSDTYVYDDGRDLGRSVRAVRSSGQN